MKDRRLLKAFIVSMVMIINVAVLLHMNIGFNGEQYKEIGLSYTIEEDKPDIQQVYYSIDGQFGEEQSTIINYTEVNKRQEMYYTFPYDTQYLRLDVSKALGVVDLYNIQLYYRGQRIPLEEYLLSAEIRSNQINKIRKIDQGIQVISTGEDPFIVIEINDVVNIDEINRVNYRKQMTLKIIACILIDLACILLIKSRRKIVVLFKDLYINRHIIWNLSKNDFKTKYAGSYLGIFWAFVQPIVTILIYWFVFEVGFKAAPADNNMPYVLWLIPGIVPWFFFAEGIMNATNSLLEYSYLVKKVVFKISILPVVKIISSLFIHLFFILIIITVFILHKETLSIYMIQVVYYMICTSTLALAISYFTSSVIVFFKDLGQIVNVLLQIGMWLTPIMWNQTMLSKEYRWILKLNPVYYIVEGYRDCFINKVWFWDKITLTVYFWLITVFCFLLGGIIFRRLKKHFADVL